jgi:hypothetical protein
MDDDLSIPGFLRRKPGEKPASATVTLAATPYVDPVLVRQAELRAAWEETRKAKRQKSLAKHLEKHAGERWAVPDGCSGKTKMWVRDQKSIDAHHAKLEADFEAELKRKGETDAT